MCADVIGNLLPKLVNIKTWEMLLAVGVLCKVDAARLPLQKHVASVLLASSAAIDALSASLKWSDAKSVRAQVDQVIGKTPASQEMPESVKGEGTECVVEPEMPAFVLNSLMEVLSATSQQVDNAVGDLVQEKATPSAAAVQALTQSLLGLLGNEAVQKDALTPCAIVLSSLIARSHDKPEAVAVQLAVAAGCHTAIDLSAYATYFVAGVRMPLISVGGIKGCVNLDPDSFLPFARQALMRGALSSGVCVCV